MSVDVTVDIIWNLTNTPVKVGLTSHRHLSNLLTRGLQTLWWLLLLGSVYVVVVCVCASVHLSAVRLSVCDSIATVDSNQMLSLRCRSRARKYRLVCLCVCLSVCLSFSVFVYHCRCHRASDALVKVGLISPSYPICLTLCLFLSVFLLLSYSFCLCISWLTDRLSLCVAQSVVSREIEGKWPKRPKTKTAHANVENGPYDKSQTAPIGSFWMTKTATWSTNQSINQRNLYSASYSSWKAALNN